MNSKIRAGFTPLENLLKLGGKHKKRQGQRASLFLTGFTLVEVLLAIAISALTLTSAYSALRLGWLSYDQMNSRSQVYQDLRNSLERFAQEARNSFIFNAKDDYKIFFNGKHREMSFCALIPIRNKDGKIHAAPARIFYKFEDDNLLRACLEEKDILSLSVEPEYEVFLSNLSAVDFYYGRKSLQEELTWEESFDDKDALPLAVRMKLTLKTDNSSAQPFTKSVILGRPD